MPEIVASGARTADGNSNDQGIGAETDELILLLDVTAQSGTTPTLDVDVEWSDDGGLTYAVADPADAFTQITTTLTKVVHLFKVLGSTWRVRWQIAGTTPSYTFAVDAYERAT